MSAQDEGTERKLLYGRRRGRALRPGQRRRVEEGLPRLRFELPAKGPLDPRTLFVTAPAQTWLELGFGGGEHLAAQAALYPEIGMIGAEVFENGIAKLVREIDRGGLGNVRIFADDARALVAALAPASVARVFVLFPDPWPKERHKKRRIISSAFLDHLGNAMADGAELRLATDDMDYAGAMIERAAGHPAFRRLDADHDWRRRPDDWPPTRYEQKALARGRAPVYLRFSRSTR